ncbi:MAG: DUF2783 domain-containing protein [Anaerolineae bacterium]|nr:DUF2783 domain-containing protein [Anaerolineae bacterium]
MSALNTEPRLANPDKFYKALSQLYDHLDEAASLRASARLILLLANHIGDETVLLEAIARAKRDDKVTG